MKPSKLALLMCSAVLASAQVAAASLPEEAIGVTEFDAPLRPGQLVSLAIRGTDCKAESIIDHRRDWADGSVVWTVQTLNMACRSRQTHFEVSRIVKGGVVAGVLLAGTNIPLGLPLASIR